MRYSNFICAFCWYAITDVAHMCHQWEKDHHRAAAGQQNSR